MSESRLARHVIVLHVAVGSGKYHEAFKTFDDKFIYIVIQTYYSQVKIEISSPLPWSSQQHLRHCQISACVIHVLSYQTSVSRLVDGATEKKVLAC